MPRVIHAPATVALLDAVSRRGFVSRTAAALVACALGACGSDSADSAGGGGGPTAPGGGPALPAGVTVAGDVVTINLTVHAALRSAGSLLMVNQGADGVRLVVVGFGGGEFGAFTSVCTHAGTVNRWARTPAGALTCENHGSVFDARTGAALVGPARLPLRRYPVEAGATALTIRVG